MDPKLVERCNGLCELCAEGKASVAYAVSPKNHDAIEHEVALCAGCNAIIENNAMDQPLHFLAGSIWSAEPSVQALSYRLLYARKEQGWAEEILSSVEPDEAVVDWAMDPFQLKDVHKDCYGKELEAGDTVVLTESLNVKGTSFRAPAGTVVRKIRLVPGNTDQVEGKINDQTIVILTKYVRKSAS
ncbi:MAG: PhnA domain-containing protein [Chitinophagaceae bacterium]|jgi:protein PhnA|nr:PhnA domain-containing protein [Chitinophagaceae bacterium]